MTLPTARIAQYNAERETSRIEWSDDTRGEYSMRGGIAWPTGIPNGRPGGFEVQGYAIMCALNVATDKATVVEHLMFNAIEPEFDAEGKAVPNIHPLMPFLLRCWSRYYANRFYWHDVGETNQQYRRLIGRNELIQPKPRLTRVFWDNENAAVQVMWSIVTAGKLTIPEGMYQDVMAGDRESGGWLSPARHALMVCLVGMQRWPWRMRTE